jgi:hypothetical protein
LSEALVLLPLNKMALRVIGYRRWRAVLGALLPRDSQAGHDVHGPSGPAPQRIAQLVHAASREGTSTGACLERALALWWLLRRRHFPAELRIGGRHQAGRFEAHAWVQLDEAVLNDDEALLHYTPFENPAAGPENLTGEKS